MYEQPFYISLLHPYSPTNEVQVIQSNWVEHNARDR